MEHTSTSFLKKLAEFKNLEIAIPKDTKAYGYNYSPLDTILPIIQPLLKSKGLAYFHRTDYDPVSWRTYLETTIYEIETDGILGSAPGYITSRILIDEDVVLAKMNKFMVIGSALTYFRRYHLVTMLGLLTDEDDDATGGGTIGGGRSIESKTTAQDFVKTFKGLIEAGRTKAQIDGFYKKYSHVFSDDQKVEIEELIVKNFSVKK